MVERAAARGGQARYVVGNMERIPFGPGSFDRCISLGALHCANFNAVAESVSQVLKENGEFLLLTEAGIIPLLAPDTGPARIRQTLEKHGFDVADEKRIGRLYAWFRGRKQTTE